MSGVREPNVHRRAGSKSKQLCFSVFCSVAGMGHRILGKAHRTVYFHYVGLMSSRVVRPSHDCSINDCTRRTTRARCDAFIAPKSSTYLPRSKLDVSWSEAKRNVPLARCDNRHPEGTQLRRRVGEAPGRVDSEEPKGICGLISYV